jgi:hypothetical protein
MNTRNKNKRNTTQPPKVKTPRVRRVTKRAQAQANTMAAPMVARVPPVLPKFRGDSCPVQFLQKFEYAMKINGWAKDHWFAQLGNSLEGPADQFHYRWLDDTKIAAQAASDAAIAGGGTAADGAAAAAALLSFDQLALALQATFRSFSDKDSTEQKWRNRKQRLNEPVETFANDFLHLIKAYDKTIPETEQVRRMISNSRPSYIPLIKLVQPKTIEAYLEVARGLETSFKIVGDREEVAAIQANVVTAAYEKYNPTSDDRKQSYQKTSDQINASKIGSCFGCGGDHLRKDCTINPQKCFKCGGKHYARFCKVRRSANQNQGESNKQAESAVYPQLPRFQCLIHGDSNHKTEDCRVIKKQQSLLKKNANDGQAQQAGQSAAQRQ